MQYFRRLAEEAGRDPSAIGITIFAWGHPPPQRLDSYREIGIERVVVGPPSFDLHDEGAVLKYLDHWAPIAEGYR